MTMRSFLLRLRADYVTLLGQEVISPRVQRVLVSLIVATCLVVRLWTIDAPPLDRTTWKEIDYLTISTNYWQHGFKFFEPEVTWPAEPPRITALELPLVPYATALLYPLFGVTPYSARILSTFGWLLMCVYVFRLAKRELGPLAGVLSALASSIMPLYHPMGRILFSDPIMLAMSVMALFHFSEWVEYRRTRDGFVAMGAFSLAVALKLEPLYLLLPILWIAFRQYRWRLGEYRRIAVLIGCALILPVLWYSYAYYLAHTYSDVFGVFGGIGGRGAHNKFQTLTMLSSREWYSIMCSRLTEHILGGKIGTLLFLVGLFMALFSRTGQLFLVYGMTIGIYFGLVAEGQLDAHYRQLASVPPFAGFMALGSLAICATFLAAWRSFGNSFSPVLWHARLCFLGGVALIALVGFHMRWSIFGEHLYSPYHPITWEFAQVIKSHAERNSKLITVGEYTIHKGGNDLSPVLYYYSDLQGWSLQAGEWDTHLIETLIAKGATHFAAVQMSREPDAEPFLREMKSRYPLLYEKDDMALFDLRPASHATFAQR